VSIVRVWRISHKQYADSAFTGEGARLYGGRFNSQGLPAVYTSGNLSLALLEMLVQSNDRHYFSFCVSVYADIPITTIKQMRPDILPEGWDAVPYNSTSQLFGDKWIEDGQSAVLKVPSVVVPVEWNYIINPVHPDFKKIEISELAELPFDERLAG
jgi:RES domain-containing protein